MAENEERSEGSEERQIVVFSLGSEEFGVNINEVREIIRSEEITNIPNTRQFVKGVINLRGSIIVVIDLAMKLGLPSKEADKNTRIIVIEMDENNIGMIVDSATEVLRLSTDQIRPAPAVITEKIDASYIEGVGILGERLLILLDLAKVLQGDDVNVIEQVQAMERPKPTTPKAAKPETPKPKEKVPADTPDATPDEPADVTEPAGEPAKTSESTTTDAKHPTLQDVHHDYHFITHEGKPLKNIHDLLAYVKDLPTETFQEFVNEEKNDFHNWIKYAVKDDELAERIEHVKDKKDVTNEIMKHILDVKLGEK